MAKLNIIYDSSTRGTKICNLEPATVVKYQGGVYLLCNGMIQHVSPSIVSVYLVSLETGNLHSVGMGGGRAIHPSTRVEVLNKATLVLGGLQVDS